MDNMFNPTSGAGDAPQLIPDKTLHFAQVAVKELKKSQNTGGTYARLELTLIDGPYEGRKVFTIVMNPLDKANVNEAKRAEGKPDGAKMGLTALTRMLEAARIFDPAQPDTYRQFDSKPFEAILQALDTHKVAVKIKIAEGKDGYESKNEISEYLSPNPQSGGNRAWTTLIGGQPAVAQARAAAFTAPRPAAQPAAPSNAPAWLKKPGVNA